MSSCTLHLAIFSRVYCVIGRMDLFSLTDVHFDVPFPCGRGGGSFRSTHAHHMLRCIANVNTPPPLRLRVWLLL